MKKLLRWLGEQLIGNALQQAFELGKQTGASEERVKQLRQRTRTEIETTLVEVQG